MNRPGDQILNTTALCLCGGQGCAHDFVPAGKGYFTARHLANFRGQTVVDFVPDYQEPKQSSIGSSAAINGLEKSLVEMMLAHPPVAGFSSILIERLLEIFFSGVSGESGSLGMQGDDPAPVIDQHKKIAGSNL